MSTIVIVYAPLVLIILIWRKGMSGEAEGNAQPRSLEVEVQGRDDAWYMGAVRFMTTVLDQVGPTGKTPDTPDHTDG